MICNLTKNLQHLITFYDKTKLDLLNLFQFTIKIIFVTFKLVEVYHETLLQILLHLKSTKSFNGNEQTQYRSF